MKLNPKTSSQKSDNVKNNKATYGIVWFVAVLLVIQGSLASAQADESLPSHTSEQIEGTRGQSQDQMEGATASSSPSNAAKIKNQKSRSRAGHTKGIHGKEEAEGTHAPNRFGSEIIIKSKYELNGQSLEVDTD